MSFCMTILTRKFKKIFLLKKWRGKPDAFSRRNDSFIFPLKRAAYKRKCYYIFIFFAQIINQYQDKLCEIILKYEGNCLKAIHMYEWRTDSVKLIVSNKRD